MTKTNSRKTPRTDGRWLRWNAEEQNRFWNAFNRVGKDWVSVAKEVMSRDRVQCRSFYLKFMRDCNRRPDKSPVQPQEATKDMECQTELLHYPIPRYGTGFSMASTMSFPIPNMQNWMELYAANFWIPPQAIAPDMYYLFK